MDAAPGLGRGGSVFGNVASPLADTSVLSAMVSKCTMLEHVASQAGYVSLTAALALLAGAIPVGLGLYNIWVALALSLAVLGAAPIMLGRGGARPGCSWRSTWLWSSGWHSLSRGAGVAA